MDYASFEVGELPVNDPTIEEGCVMVKRSVLLNNLITHHCQVIVVEEPDLVPLAVIEKARLATIVALHEMGARNLADSDLSEDPAERMAQQLIIGLYRDIPYTGKPVRVFLAILPHNTMVVIYNYVEAEERSLH